MKKLFLSVFMVFLSTFLFGQETSITGKVIDSKTLKPLSNVLLTIESTNQIRLSGSNGIFKFDKAPSGNQNLVVKVNGYTTQVFALEISLGATLDIGTIVMEEDIKTELQLSLVTLTESDLGDDNSGSESTSGLLQASRDVYQQAAAFNWGQARFRIRGLDNAYGNTMINGISMNKIYDGRPQWNNWGGLNDATRNQEFTMGSAPSDYTFGGILGTQEINTRASFYRPGTRITMSGTNTNYNFRSMVTHASGFNKNGWAFVISGSRRWAQEGYFDGTDYDANSLFASIEKKINEKHSINFTSIYSQNSRGKTSPNTDEVNNIMGVRYNSLWGFQDGKKRNSRDRHIEEPINMLSHYWKFNEKTRLNTNISYQTGSVGNTRLDFQLAPNPDPTYYRGLPSYFFNQPDLYNVPTISPGGVITGYTNPSAANALTTFQNNSQINWNQLYLANQSSVNAGRSVYVLYEDRTDDDLWNANSILTLSISENISLDAAVNFKRLKSNNFQNLIDLMGGQYFSDIDPFFVGNAAQADLNNPNRQVGENEKYGYNYNLFATVIDAFTQFKFNYKKIDFYLSQSFARTEYKREGLYRNGIYANNSFGDSRSVNFENFGFKGGLTYKINGRNLINFNALYMTKAPILRNVFSNARLNNTITPNITDENITSFDASYIIRAPKLKARLSGFYNAIKNSSEISFFYAESIGENEGEEDSFVSEIVTDIDKQSMGVELGIEYQITSTIKVNGAGTFGQYIYSDNAQLTTNDDNLAATVARALRNFGTAYLKDYIQPGVPQQAYSVGIEYRDPNFWWIGANANWLEGSYVDVASITRTDNFTIDPSTGISYPGANENNVRNILRQEQFDDITLINLIGGKSWRISKKNRNTVGFFASINNVFDYTYKTGGFEQARKATYPDLVADQANGTPSFAPRYFYGFGRTYFVNFYLNF
jgi:hypothetical protein